ITYPPSGESRNDIANGALRRWIPSNDRARISRLASATRVSKLLTLITSCRRCRRTVWDYLNTRLTLTRRRLIGNRLILNRLTLRHARRTNSLSEHLTLTVRQRLHILHSASLIHQQVRSRRIRQETLLLSAPQNVIRAKLRVPVLRHQIRVP